VQVYHHKRTEAHKISRNKKKLYIKNIIESLEEDQKHNNTRKICQTINQFKERYQHKHKHVFYCFFYFLIRNNVKINLT